MGLNIEVKEKYSAPSIELHRSTGLCADLEVSEKLSTGKGILLEKIAVTHNPFRFKSILRVKNLGSGSNLLPKNCYARSNSYTVEPLNNREGWYFNTSRLDSFPEPEYFERFRDSPNVAFINVYVNFDLFLPTTDRSCDAWRWLPGEPVSLVRTIEVWHYQLTKRRTSELFAKLARSTHVKRASLPGILGNWLKKDYAKKEQDFWTFDVTKLLEYYKLKPLTPEAIEAFKLRGKAFQARYN